MDPTGWWAKLIYALALAFWRAYFDMEQARQEAQREVPDATDAERAARFRDAVNRRLRALSGNPGSDGAASGVPGDPGHGVGPST
jgi:hypothetical protein